MQLAHAAAVLPEEDQDLRNLIDNSRDLVLQVRVDSAALFGLGTADPARVEIQDRINDAGAVLQGRADAHGITLDQLFLIVNANLRASPPDGGRDRRPEGDYLRALIDEVNRAYAREARIHHEIRRWQEQLPGAIEGRIAADRACAGFVAGWPARGR